MYIATNLEELRLQPGGIHELKGNFAGRLAIKLKHGIRMILRPAGEPPPCKPDGGLDWPNITGVIVEGMIDYHGKIIR